MVNAKICRLRCTTRIFILSITSWSVVVMKLKVESLIFLIKTL